MALQHCPISMWQLPDITVDRLDATSFIQVGGGARLFFLCVSIHSTTYPLMNAVDLSGGFQLTKMLPFPMGIAETF